MIKSNMSEVIVKMQLLQGAIPQEQLQAVHQWSETTMTESKQETPVDTGTLRASGNVQTRAEGTKIITTLGFGGPAAAYAEIVHEDLDAAHGVGKAKYLEDPIRRRENQLRLDVAMAFERAKHKAGLI